VMGLSPNCAVTLGYVNSLVLRILFPSPWSVSLFNRGALTKYHDGCIPSRASPPKAPIKMAKTTAAIATTEFIWILKMTSLKVSTLFVPIFRRCFMRTLWSEFPKTGCAIRCWGIDFHESSQQAASAHGKS